jgi:hypothetical protein
LIAHWSFNGFIKLTTIATYDLQLSDVEIMTVPGWVVATEGGVTVAIEANRDYIAGEVQAISLELADALNSEAIDIEMDEFVLRVSLALA